MSEKEGEFWNSPFYKPKTRLHPVAWDEFLQASAIILENQKRRIADPSDKDPEKYRELEIYDVFNWMRQQWLGELPWTKKRIAQIDDEIEKELRRDAARRAAEQITR